MNQPQPVLLAIAQLAKSGGFGREPAGACDRAFFIRAGALQDPPTPV